MWFLWQQNHNSWMFIGHFCHPNFHDIYHLYFSLPYARNVIDVQKRQSSCLKLWKLYSWKSSPFFVSVFVCVCVCVCVCHFHRRIMADVLLFLIMHICGLQCWNPTNFDDDTVWQGWVFPLFYRLNLVLLRPRRSIETIASFDQWSKTIENHWKRW